MTGVQGYMYPVQTPRHREGYRGTSSRGMYLYPVVPGATSKTERGA